MTDNQVNRDKYISFLSEELAIIVIVIIKALHCWLRHNYDPLNRTMTTTLTKRNYLQLCKCRQTEINSDCVLVVLLRFSDTSVLSKDEHVDALLLVVCVQLRKKRLSISQLHVTTLLGVIAVHHVVVSLFNSMFCI